MYTELHSRSAFSFLEGASTPEKLAEMCSYLGMSGMALLDRDGVYGSPRFHMAATKAKVKAHIGAEIIFDFRFSIFDFENRRQSDNPLPPRRHGSTEEIGSSDHRVIGSSVKANHGFSRIRTHQAKGRLRPKNQNTKK